LVVVEITAVKAREAVASLSLNYYDRLQVVEQMQTEQAASRDGLEIHDERLIAVKAKALHAC
jgi:hypothetical protein